VRHQPVHLLALAAFTALAPIGVLVYVGEEKVYLDGWVHVVCVAIGAAIATIAALALTVAGARQRDGRAVLVGVAFSVMAALLFLHGLTTPFVWFEMNGVVALTGGSTIPVGGAILALSALPAVARPGAVKPLLWLLAASVTVILGLGLAALVDPALVPGVPEARSWEAWTLLAVGLFFYGILALRTLRTYRLTHRRGDLAVAVGIAWLAVAMIPALTQDYWNIGWWLAHGLELAGIALVALPVALDLKRGAAQSRPLAGDISAVQLVLHEEAFLGSHVRALLVSLAAKDTSTEEHTRRVALRAVEVGEEIGLSPAQLRGLALGGLLHDMGKLATPTEILRKPGALSDDELVEIRRHPVDGDALLRDLGGFSPAVLRLVRHHHERLDGSGYPDRLAADELPLDTRILAVCDVYDALVSDRVYREAWTHERAVALLRNEAQFDQRCVDALETVVARERGTATSAVLAGTTGRRATGSFRAAAAPSRSVAP
jgi:HD-GYP domain-containing protein (c-di-GMP phosphodiesterase class II)